MKKLVPVRDFGKGQQLINKQTLLLRIDTRLLKLQVQTENERENYSNGTQTKRFFPPSRPFHSLSSQEEEEEVKKQIEMKSKANGRRAHTRQWGRRFLP